MSAAEYDVEQPYSLETTEAGYNVLQFPDTATAENIMEEFSREYDTRTLETPSVLGVDFKLRAELLDGGTTFTGIVYTGDDTVIATDGARERLEETADRILTPGGG